MNQKYIIVIGSPMEGLRCIGPFGTHEDAIRYTDKHLAHGTNWWVMELEAPEQ